MFAVKDKINNPPGTAQPFLTAAFPCEDQSLYYEHFLTSGREYTLDQLSATALESFLPTTANSVAPVRVQPSGLLEPNPQSTPSPPFYTEQVFPLSNHDGPDFLNWVDQEETSGQVTAQCSGKLYSSTLALRNGSRRMTM